jgi:hypothetical protein
MKEPRKHNGATLCHDLFCKDCGWPVIHACCNDEMKKFECDYWGYCSNKGCKNHEGEEWDQFDPEFSYRSTAEKIDVVIEEYDRLKRLHEIFKNKITLCVGGKLGHYYLVNIELLESLDK